MHGRWKIFPLYHTISPVESNREKGSHKSHQYYNYPAS